jgi:hypothetical protein
MADGCDHLRPDQARRSVKEGGPGQERAMFDLSVVASDGRWLLVDESEGELGEYDTCDEALKAAGDFAVLDREPRHVLIQDAAGEWQEAVVGPPQFH